ncbi:MmoB/DmpM family protein [Streptomyces sp. RB6PN25]|uniref:MmoB/DmpM family protein n=1 Tax=Streptomyces humicola TaxID=2953240 RepID=A0ABT1PRD5_9ACTN|nr:MmoB/DmpM family protein [Streptomyces humicola]MCQ4079130.1 MmoB/DmpM family protein [Streptomyces humicola]
MTSEATDVRKVGVDLQEATEDTRRVVEAIERDNEDATVSYLPGLVKIQAPGRLVVRRQTVEDLLGRPWETHEFQLAIVSYYGHIAEWDDDEIVIKWDH